MLVSFPINLPKLEPDDWSRWWKIWNTYAAPLTKINSSPNASAGKHIGFDVYRSATFAPTYSANFVDLQILYPELYNQVMRFPFEINGARFVEAGGDFPPHVDHVMKYWSIRNMFYCEDTESQWYYTDMQNKNIVHLHLPKETNWWVYLDGEIKHGTTYNPKFRKIILQIFAKSDYVKEFVSSSIGTFNDYEIYYDKDT